MQAVGLSDRNSADEVSFRAIAGRDSRYDGVLVYGVKTTGVYCRPSCPSRTPRPENVQYFVAGVAAEAAGFRPCRRCQPQRSVPDATDRLVRTAADLIADGLVDDVGVAGLAGRLCISQRHLNRLLQAHLGASAQTLAHARRAQAARLLLQQTRLSISEVAFAAGFGSIRQFNDALRATFGRTPSELRSDPDLQHQGEGGLRVRLRLQRTEPYDADALLTWYRARAVPSLERVDAHGLQRALATPAGSATVTARDRSDGWIVQLELVDPVDLGFVVSRLRAWLDLDADSQQIERALEADPAMAELVRRRRGLRVPLWPDPWEGVIRTVLGQQVSVAAAATLTDRLVTLDGSGHPDDSEHQADSEHLNGVEHPERPGPAPNLRGFPGAEVLADARIGFLPRRRADTLRRLAELVASGVDPGTAAGLRELGEVPGVGPWTAQYWRLRVLGDPDAWPGSDLVLRREISGLGTGDPDPDRWRPWRAYAAQHIWTNAADQARTEAREGQ